MFYRRRGTNVQQACEEVFNIASYQINKIETTLTDGYTTTG